VQVLPIDAVLDEARAALLAAENLVVEAPPGAGKTTRLPVAALQTVRGGAQVWVVTPRRIAALAAARRVAQEQGWRAGGEVGWQVRFDTCVTAATALRFMTPGIFLQRLEADPGLAGVGVLFFDEFHERSLEVDLALAMAREAQGALRPDLRVVVMSATLEVGPVAAFLAPCRVIQSAGALHPVTLSHARQEGAADHSDLAPRVAAAVQELLAETAGDVLVFLPGMREIEACRRRLESALGATVTVLRLHGGLPLAEQDAALASGAGRRVVLATNVAETSLTIPGVTGVVDSGLVRRLAYDAGCDLERLELTRIDRAAAAQRAGRAGRLAPGRCHRLWTPLQEARLAAAQAPEVRRLELASTLLTLLAWGAHDPNAFAWFEAPPAAALQRGMDLLHGLGARDAHGLTSVGQRMCRWPLPARLARLMVAAQDLDCLPEAAWVAALLAEGRQRATWPGGDAVDVCEAAATLARAEAERDATVRWLHRVARQIAATHHAGGKGGNAPPPWRHAAAPRLATALAAAFPDRVALCRPRANPAESLRAKMVGQRGVVLPHAATLAESKLLLCLDLAPGARGAHAEAQVYRACALRSEDLELQSEQVIRFDPTGQRVEVWELGKWRDLVVHERLVPPPHGAKRQAEVEAALVAAAAAEPAQALDLQDAELQRFMARVAFLAQAMPELQWPTHDAEFFRAHLPELCRGQRSFTDLRRRDLLPLVRATLDHRQQEALRRHAPEELTLASGRRVKIDYRQDPPVIAARIQDFFGMERVPPLAAGRVPPLLHLLAPNQRVQQMTQDLASFWQHTYPSIRKALRGRYVKHAWPENPLTYEKLVKK